MILQALDYFNLAPFLRLEKGKTMIKKLAKSIGEYKKETILTPCFVALETVLDVVIPFLMAILIDEGIMKSDSKNIWFIGIALILCSFVALLFGALAGKYAAKASAGFAKNLRKNVFYNVQTFSFSNIDKFSTGSLVTRHTTDIVNIQRAFQVIIRMAIRSPLMLIFSLIMAFYINSELALIFLIAIPILGLGLFRITQKAHPVFEEGIKIYDDLNVTIQENVRGMRVVKSYVTEDKEIEKFNKTSQKIYDLFSKAEKYVALNGPLMQFTVSTIIVLIAWVGGKQIVHGSLTTGE